MITMGFAGIGYIACRRRIEAQHLAPFDQKPILATR
jgi:hypothetical protein